MIKTIDELKELIIFAREQKLKSLKIGEIHLEISDLAHVTDLASADTAPRNTAVTASMGELLDELGQDNEDDEDLLFHSSRP